MNDKATVENEFDQIDNTQERNARILTAIDDSPSGEIKSASASGTNMIRRRIREEGFLRRIIPPQSRQPQGRHIPPGINDHFARSGI
jgi:hypothetical protein